MLCLIISGKTEFPVDEMQEASQPLVVIDERYAFLTDVYRLMKMVAYSRFKMFSMFSKFEIIPGTKCS